MIEEAPGDAPVPAAESQILWVLAGHPGRTIGELADEIALLPEAARAILRDLCRRGLVWRPISGREAGRWRLTSLGSSSLLEGIQRP